MLWILVDESKDIPIIVGVVSNPQYKTVEDMTDLRLEYAGEGGDDRQTYAFFQWLLNHKGFCNRAFEIA